MIYHWCPAQDWDAADESYRAPSLSDEGFIHFSFREQVERTATAIDRGLDDLVLLCVDDSDLSVVVEDSYDIGEEFPHVYGLIPKSAVSRVVPFPCKSDGSFRLPPGA